MIGEYKFNSSEESLILMLKENKSICISTKEKLHITTAAFSLKKKDLVSIGKTPNTVSVMLNNRGKSYVFGRFV